MKTSFTCVLAFILFLMFSTACNHPNKKEDAVLSVTLRQIRIAPFSDLLKSDTFKVELTGHKPKDMLFTFTIHAFDGHQIYHQVWPASELIDNYKKTVDLDKEENQLRFLKEELNLFFEEENFLEPAITPEEQPDQNTSDKEFYAELKQTGLNGFKYRLGKETKVYIGWSVKAHQVKIYYKCC